MAEPVAAHQEHAVLQAFVRTDRKWIFRHHLFDARGSAVASSHHYPSHQVALRKYADQKTVAKYRHRADIAIDHRHRHVERELLGVGAISILVGNQIVNMHGLTLPGTSFQSKPREYMPKCDGFKVPESCMRAPSVGAFHFGPIKTKYEHAHNAVGIPPRGR